MTHIQSIQLIYCKMLDQLEHPKLWAIITAFGLFITQYVFSQWPFAIGFFIIFIMDTISGTYIAWRQINPETGKPRFSGDIFRSKLMDKCIAYFTIIISFSAGTKILLEDSSTNLIKYLNVPFYTIFIVIELRSIIRSWYLYTKWEILERLLQIVDYVPKRPNQPKNPST